MEELASVSLVTILHNWSNFCKTFEPLLYIEYLIYTISPKASSAFHPNTACLTSIPNGAVPKLACCAGSASL